MALKHYLPALPAEFPAATGTPPATPANDDYVNLDGNLIRWDATASKWVPVEARRLPQLPYDSTIADVEVWVTNDRWPLGHRFTMHEGHWVDPDLPMVCPACGQSQIVEPSGAGTRRVINGTADFIALKPSIVPGDVIHLRHPAGGTGAKIIGYFDQRGDRISGRTNPMPNGTVGAPITFTADPDVLMGGADPSGVCIDVGEVDHVHHANLKIVGGFHAIRHQAARGTAEQLQRVSHVDASETTAARFPFQAFHSNLAEWSSFIQYDCCSAHTELTGITNPEFSEGHYLGTGAVATIGQDQSHDVHINNGDFYGLTAEAIECKPGVRRVWIDGVKAKNMRFTPHGGLGVTAVFSLSVPGANYTPAVDDVEIHLSNFEVDGYDEFYAVATGHGGVTIKNGTVRNATGAAAGNAAVRVRSVAPYGTGPDGGMPIVIEDITTAAGQAKCETFDPEDQNPVVIQRDKPLEHLSVSQFSGRAAMPAVSTWYGINEQWGHNNEVWQDVSGTGATPDIGNQNDRAGILVPPGATIERIQYWYRWSADVTDFEVAFGLLTPISATSMDDGLTSVAQIEWRPVYQSLRSAFPAGNSNATNRPYGFTVEPGVTNRSSKPVDLVYHARRTAGGSSTLFFHFAVEISLP